MRTIWQSLAWKEWHEHKWRLAALTTIQCVISIVAFGNGYGVGQDQMGAVLGMAMAAGSPLAIFIGAGDAAGERSRGTMPFLQSLPVQLWRVALFKLCCGLLTVIIPAFCAVGVLFVIHWMRDKLGYTPGVVSWLVAQGGNTWTTGNRLIDVAVVVSVLSASLYLWTVAGGSRRGDEVSAGAFGLLFIVGWWCLLMLIGLVFVGTVGNAALPYQRLEQSIATIGIATAPLGVLVALDNQLPMFTAAIVVSLVAHTALGFIYLYRFASPPNLGERSPQVAARVRDPHDWLKPVFGSPWKAIAWKQARESGPPAIVGATGVLVVFLIVLATVWFDENSWSHYRVDDAARLYGTITFGLGTFISLVAGVGVAVNDTSSKLNGFWRSRPVNPSLWYWTKYATGMSILFGALYLPLVALLLILGDKAYHPASVPGIWSHEIWVMPAVQFALFSTSLTLTCLIRQAVYAAILTIGVINLSLLPFEFLRGGFTFFEALSPGEVIFSFVAVGILATIIGWLATRNDWGRRLL